MQRRVVPEKVLFELLVGEIDAILGSLRLANARRQGDGSRQGPLAGSTSLKPFRLPPPEARQRQAPSLQLRAESSG